jgi:hypothetical protein
VAEEATEWQQEKEWEKHDVPAADDENHRGEHESPKREAHRAGQRSSVYGSGVPDLARPRLIM